MKKLGFGCMRLPLTNPEEPTSVDLKQFCEMIDTFMDNGFTYFDTAYPYHQRQSELFVKDTFNKLGYKAKINTHTTSYIN